MECSGNAALLCTAERACVVAVPYRGTGCITGKVAHNTACLIGCGDGACVVAIAYGGLCRHTDHTANKAPSLNRCTVIAVIYGACASHIACNTSHLVHACDIAALDAEMEDLPIDRTEEAVIIPICRDPQIFHCVSLAVKGSAEALACSICRHTAADGDPLTGIQINVIAQTYGLATEVRSTAVDLIGEETKLCFRPQRQIIGQTGIALPSKYGISIVFPFAVVYEAVAQRQSCAHKLCLCNSGAIAVALVFRRIGSPLALDGSRSIAVGDGDLAYQIFTPCGLIEADKS